MRRRVAAGVAWLILAACALPASGCGVGPGEEQAGEGSLTVTRNFGEESLGRERTAGAARARP